jgi:hypothetical protein
MLTVAWTTIHPAPPGHTCTVIAARLPLMSFQAIPASLVWAQRIRRHLAATAGVVGHSLALEMAGPALWTVSAWSSRTHLNAFHRSDLHQAAIAVLQPKLHPLTLAVWSCTASELPAQWPDVRRRIAAGTERASA